MTHCKLPGKIFTPTVTHEADVKTCRLVIIAPAQMYFSWYRIDAMNGACLISVIIRPFVILFGLFPRQTVSKKFMFH